MVFRQRFACPDAWPALSLCRLLACLVVGTLTGTAALAQNVPVPGSGCTPVDMTKPADMATLINRVGLPEFQNAPVVRPVSEAARLDLVVEYKTLTVAGCTAHLRTYNGAIVGPTIRAKPGDTLHILLINKLPPAMHPHPQVPAPGEHAQHFSYNITNLHTHGLHVAPQGPPPFDAKGRAKFESDNVLIELQPGEQQDYRIEIAPTHATGTFWYHAHVHGATAVQVTSGMVGALTIDEGAAENGDLDTVPAIGNAKAQEKLMLLQQIWADRSGAVEDIEAFEQRPTLINGQLVPVIKMRPGEIQRWRFIHGGVGENIALAVDDHPLHEVAADGISLGRRVAWPEATPNGIATETALVLGPGYRTDVLIQATMQPQPGKPYFLRDLKLDPPRSIQAAQRALERFDAQEEAAPGAFSLAPDDLTPGQVLAQIVIEGDPVSAALPGQAELAGAVPKELYEIKEEHLSKEARQTVKLSVERRNCDDTGACTPCSGSGCRNKFMVDDRQFSSGFIRTLKLRTKGDWTAAEWDVTGFRAPHPFHIHVNPFQVFRVEPDEAGKLRQKWAWKDTVIVRGSDVPPLRMRYVKFKGKFVIHCHILDHEDRGMMQLVEITD